MLPGRPMYIEGISYWLPDLSKLRTTVANTLDVQLSSTFRSATEREMLEYEQSVPDDAQEIPLDESTKHRLGLDDYDSDSSSKSSRHSTKDNKKTITDDDEDKDESLSNPFAEDGDPREGRIPDRSNRYDTSDNDRQEQEPAAPAQAPAMTVPTAGKTAN